MSSSHFNNNSEHNNEQVFSEDQFRTVFFDSSKRVMASTSSASSKDASSTHIKRARLDSTISLSHQPTDTDASSLSSSTSSSSTSSTSVLNSSSSALSPSASSSTPLSVVNSTLPGSVLMTHGEDINSNGDVLMGPSSPSPSPSSSTTHHTVNINAVNQAAVAAVAVAVGASTSAAGDVETSSSTTISAHSLGEAMFRHQLHNSSFVSGAPCATPGCATPGCSTPMERSNESDSNNNNNASLNFPPSLKHSLSIKQKRKFQKNSKIRKFRSRSLPNLLFNTSKTNTNDKLYQKFNETKNTLVDPIIKPFTKTTITSSSPPPLPPVNIQSLREIDLSEILKNPQLRHDILFDPQLQFRPNLDGERGRRKKITYDKYWNGIKHEIESYYNNLNTGIKFNERFSKLPNLFITLKDILISLLPINDKQSVIDVLDLELILQQLSKNSLDYISLSNWLAKIFKSHCAPMRDSWVDEMLLKFIEAENLQSVDRLVEGLRMIFTILEAMKLDVANHQIRILRPVLIETAVEFERDYFSQMTSRCKLDIIDSINWFKNFHSSTSNSNESLTKAILSLLSCSKMVSEFPSSLIFDHSRLIILRANVRQLVCLQLCIALYRQLVSQHSSTQQSELFSTNAINSLKREILAIITDDNGNVKWTRNIGSISLQIVRRAIPSVVIPNNTTLEFAFNWLIKQTQPSSKVYSLMELKIFKTIEEKIKVINDDDSLNLIKLSNLIPITTGHSNLKENTSEQVSSKLENSSNSNNDNNEDDDITNISSSIALVVKFHWNVFGSYYNEALN